MPQSTQQGQVAGNGRMAAQQPGQVKREGILMKLGHVTTAGLYVKVCQSVIGRNKGNSETAEILGRRTKNNPGIGWDARCWKDGGC